MADRVHLRVLRPSEKELENLVQLWLETFVGHTWREAHFPHGKATEEEERRWRVGWKLRALKDPTHFYVIAYEQTTSPDGTVKKQIVGWTSWNSAPPPGTEKSAEDKEREEAEEMAYRPEAMDKKEQERIAADIKALYKQCYGENDSNNYWILQINCVHPSHQRKGVASKMVKWGIAEAAKNGKGVVVISTPMGRPFYVSVGFEAVAEMYIRNEAFPGMIIRPPQASAT